MARLTLEVPDWVIDKLEERAKTLGVPTDGLARSVLESGVLGIGTGSPAPSPAPPTIHNPQPSGAPPTIHVPEVHHPKPSGAPPTIHNPEVHHPDPTPAPPTIHHPASGRTVGWREVVLDHSHTCADTGTEIPAGTPAYVAMDDTGVFRTVISREAFARRTGK